MFASALTYKSCECQLAAADQEALPTKNKPLSFQALTSEVWGLKGTRGRQRGDCMLDLHGKQPWHLWFVCSAATLVNRSLNISQVLHLDIIYPHLNVPERSQLWYKESKRWYTMLHFDEEQMWARWENKDVSFWLTLILYHHTTDDKLCTSTA